MRRWLPFFALLVATAAGAAPLNDGLRLLAAGDARGARAAAQAAVRADPSSPVPHLLLARASLALDNGDTAEAEIIKARAAGAPLANTHHLLAEAYLLQGDAGRALGEADASHVPLRFGAYAARIRARARLVAGDPESAAREFDHALALAPNDPQLWTDIGRFRLDTGEQAGAIVAADKAVALDPRLTDALVLKGELARAQYGLVASLPWFDRAIAVDPHDVSALTERAATLGDLGRAGAALTATRAVLAVDPHSGRAFFLLAALAARAGEWPLARRLMDRAGDQLDDVPAAMLLDGAIGLRTGNVEQAIERLDRLLALQPGNEAVRRLKAAAEWQAGDPASALATLRPIVGPDADSYALTLAGRALERMGRRAEAAIFLDRAAHPGSAAAPPNADDGAPLDVLARQFAQDPADAGATTDYVRALLAAGRADDAARVAGEARDRNPGAPAAHLLAGDALAALGRWADAAREYRAAANISFTRPAALRLIDALRRSGDGAGALGVLNLFLGQNPQDVPARQMGADYLVATQRFPAARAMLRHLVSDVGAGDAVLLNNLAWATYRAGDKAGGIELAERARALMPANAALVQSEGAMLTESGRGRVRGQALLAEAAAMMAPEPPARSP